MKIEDLKEVEELQRNELVDLNGGRDIAEFITSAIAWFISSQGSAYEEMHDAGLLAYKH